VGLKIAGLSTLPKHVTNILGRLNAIQLATTEYMTIRTSLGFWTTRCKREHKTMLNPDTVITWQIRRGIRNLVSVISVRKSVKLKRIRETMRLSVVRSIALRFGIRLV
jgi:hypothetical protein